MKLLSLFLVGACADGDPELHVPVTTSFDLVIGDRDARLFVQGDISGQCTIRDPFAPPGTCHHADDIVDCDRDATSCLTQVSLFGVSITVTAPEPVLVWSMAAVAPQLRITGCGRDVEIDLPVMLSPTPVIQRVTRAPDGDPVVEWTHDQTSASAIVTLGPLGLGALRCHVPAASSFVFENYAAVSSREIEVRSLAPVQTLSTELGPLRIWRGNTAVGMLY